MSDSLDNLTRLRDAFTASLTAAHLRRVDLASIEVDVRAFANALRTSGVGVEAALAQVKALIAAHAGADAPRFTPGIVGWTIAGYYYGYDRPEKLS